MCQQWRKGEEKSEYRPFSFLTEIYHRKQQDNKQRLIACLASTPVTKLYKVIDKLEQKEKE